MCFHSDGKTISKGNGVRSETVASELSVTRHQPSQQWGSCWPRRSGRHLCRSVVAPHIELMKPGIFRAVRSLTHLISQLPVNSLFLDTMWLGMCPSSTQTGACVECGFSLQATNHHEWLIQSNLGRIRKRKMDGVWWSSVLSVVEIKVQAWHVRSEAALSAGMHQRIPVRAAEAARVNSSRWLLVPSVINYW